MECHQKWLKVEEPARARAGPFSYSRGNPMGASRGKHLLGVSLQLQLGVPARGSDVEYDQLDLCAASRPNSGDAGDRIPTLAAVQGPPHAVQFADTGHDALRITARLTTAGNGMPSKVATSGRIGEHARSRLPLPRRSSMDRTGAS